MKVPTNRLIGLWEFYVMAISPIRTSRFLFVLLLDELSGGNTAFLREEGGTRSVTEGARVTLDLHYLYRNALSLSRLRRQLPPRGSLLSVQLFIFNLALSQ